MKRFLKRGGLIFSLCVVAGLSLASIDSEPEQLKAPVPIVLPDRAPIILEEIRKTRLFIAASQAGHAPFGAEMPRNEWLPESWNQDKIHVKAHGQAEVIYDFSQMSGVRRGDQYTISLESSPYLRIVPDSFLTRVTRDTGLFVSPDEDLDPNARVSAEAKILKAACEKGIFIAAQAEAEAFIKDFFASGGVHQVRVLSKRGHCEENIVYSRS